MSRFLKYQSETEKYRGEGSLLMHTLSFWSRVFTALTKELGRGGLSARCLEYNGCFMSSSCPPDLSISVGIMLFLGYSLSWIWELLLFGPFHSKLSSTL